MSKKTFDVGVRVTMDINVSVKAKNQNKADEIADEIADDWNKLMKKVKKGDSNDIIDVEVVYVDKSY